MAVIWFGLFMEILVLALTKSIIEDHESMAILAVSLHSIFTIFILMSSKYRLKLWFLCAFSGRIALMLWDLYASHLFILPNSGADTEVYFQGAALIGNDISYLAQDLRGGVYSKIMGLLYYAIGTERIMGQYINVLLGLTIIYIVYKIMLTLGIRPRVCTIVIGIASFFPNSIIMSAIFLREMFVTFFVSISVLYFVKWYRSARYIEMVLSIVMLGCASVFHSGVIGIIVGYSYAFLFYRKRAEKFKFTGQTVGTFILIVAIASVGFTMFDEVLLGKFGSVDDISDIYSTANTRLGRSAYLTGVTIDNPIDLIVFGPVKAFFFLTAPLPMNWRGILDIFTFITDSLLYFYIMYYWLKNRKRFGRHKALITILMITVIGSAYIFGIGVGNAGTAVRHRQKLISIFLVLLAVMMDSCRKPITLRAFKMIGRRSE